MDNVNESVGDENLKLDKSCQADFLSDSNEAEKTFICNTYIYINAEKSDAQTQTEISDVKKNYN